MCAVALFESLSADGILSFVAAAFACLIEQHVIPGDDGRGVGLLGAVASEGRLSVDDGVSAAAADHVRTWEGKLLALGQRGVGHAARAVLGVHSINGRLVEASALLADNKRD